MRRPFPPQREYLDQDGTRNGEDAALLGAICLGLFALAAISHPALLFIVLCGMAVLIYKHFVTQRRDSED